mgnify:CR=1 FL=1
MKKNVDIPINVIYHERITENGIYKEWEKTKTKEYFEYRKNWTEWPQKDYVGAFPLNLDIEPTNCCNLKCPFCYRTITIEKNIEAEIDWKGVMSLDTYKNIMSQIVVDGKCMVPAIKLTHRGEPTINKNLPEMIRLAKEAGAIDVMMNTNGTLLTEELGEKILDAGVDKVFFSFDSPYAEKYENTRIGASYTQVLNNIKKFVELRNRKKQTKTLIRVGMVITHDTLPNETEDFYELFKDIVDVVSYNSVHEEIEVDCDGNYADNNGKTHNIKDRKFADSQLWQRMTVNWNGDTEICCENYKQEWSLGNVNKASISEIWTGEAFSKVREAHRNGEWWKIPQCRKCTIPHME